MTDWACANVLRDRLRGVCLYGDLACTHGAWTYRATVGKQSRSQCSLQSHFLLWKLCVLNPVEVSAGLSDYVLLNHTIS